ncbi:MAG: hypothetical protein DI554_05905 [Sphingobium sp.]|nr:MAG: hypothetical protein DI554_05905 [Sphingobium sp.]
MKRAIAFLSLAFASPALAAPVAIGFAPPTGQDLLYRIEQHRPVDGRDSLFRADRILRFEKAGDGYILHVTLRSLDSDAPGAGADAYRAALSPLIGVEHRFRLDAHGKIVGLDNVDDVRAAMEKALNAMVARAPEGSAGQRTAKNVLALLDGLTPEGRLALLSGEVQPLLLFVDSEVDDARPRGVRTMAGTVAAHDGNRLTLQEDLQGEGSHVTMRYTVSAQTGLVDAQERTLTLGAQTLTEKRSLTAAGK